MTSLVLRQRRVRGRFPPTAGVVEANLNEQRMRVSFGSPRQVEDVFSGKLGLGGWDKRPLVGSRVTLDWWNGKIVAVHDPARDTHYKTQYWRDEGTDRIPAIILVVIDGFGIALLAWLGIASLVEDVRSRLRRRRPAAS